MENKNKYFDPRKEAIFLSESNGLLFDPFNEKNSPLRMADVIDNESIMEVRFIKQFINFLIKVKEEQPIKLTQKGNLPRKFCREFLVDNWPNQFFKEFMEEFPVSREEDSSHIHRINILAQVGGFVRKSNRKLMVTKKTEKFLMKEDYYQIYKNVFLASARKINWAYFDNYPQAQILQEAFGLTLFWLSQYGDKPINSNFYANKLNNVFPDIPNNSFTDNNYNGEDKLKKFEECYFLRTFERFLENFGLVEIKNKGDFLKSENIIKKTDFFDKFIKWKHITGIRAVSIVLE